MNSLVPSFNKRESVVTLIESKRKKKIQKKGDYTIVHHPRFLQDQEYVRMQLQQRSDQMAWSLLGKKSFQ
jgi:hypothetical protein